MTCLASERKRQLASFLKARLLLPSCLVFVAISSAGYAYQSKIEEDGVIYPSNIQNKKVLQKDDGQVSPEDAYKMKYVPLGNDPTIDPLSHNYEQWLEEMRNNTNTKADVDEDYEKFVKEVGPLLFSLGYNEMSPDVKDLLAKIPANSLDPVGSQFLPEGPIDVEREAAGVDPFEGKPEAEETVLGRDVGLNITVSEPSKKSEELMALAYDAMKLGQMEGAAELYEKVLEKDSENKEALFGLAATYHRMGQFDEAREVYVQLLTDDPNNWSAMNNLMLLAGEESPEDALKELKELELINPEFSPIPAQIAVIYIRLNKAEEAIKYLTRAIILSPDNLAYRYNLAVILDHSGFKAPAARLYNQLLQAAKEGKELPESVHRIRERLDFINSSPLAKGN